MSAPSAVITVIWLGLCHRARSRHPGRGIAAFGLWAGYVALGLSLPAGLLG